jgi:two-component system sensor histidine kinase AlgZ
VQKMHVVTRTLLTCFLVSLAAPIGVLIVFQDLRPLVRESFIVGFFYSTAIAFLSRAAVPPVVRWVGKPGWKLTMALSLTLIATAAVGSLIAGGLLLPLGLGTAAQFWGNYFFMVRIVAALALVSGLGSNLYESLTSQLREARALALEARLSSLESRIQPHFLFNTLNSISALIRVDPQRAEETVGRLATLLRSSLSSVQQGLIPLEAEMRIVQDYLEIEKTRFGDRLQYSFKLGEGAGSCLVPPFSVQCLVENAVKHSIAVHETGGRIEVRAEKDEERMTIEIHDTGSGFDLSHVNSGHGLDNLISRLETTFGSAAGLDVSRRNGECVVALRIPI